MEKIVIGRSPEDQAQFGDKALGLLGNLFDERLEMLTEDQLMLDMAKPHVIIISGKRGSGKSYTMGSIVEEISRSEEVRKQVCCLIIDTMGIFHSMKEPNDSEREVQELQKLGLEPASFPVQVLVPRGLEDMLQDEFGSMLREKGYRLDYDQTFEIELADITADDWREIFRLDQNEPMGILLDRVIRKARELETYDFDDMLDLISRFSKGGRTRTGAALLNRFDAARDWRVFGRKGLDIKEVITGGRIVVLDLSYLSHISKEWNLRALPVAVLARHIARKATVYARLRDMHPKDIALQKEFPIVWMFIDEGHQLLPSGSATPATYPLIEWIRQGRHPGLSLVIASQMPRRLHSDALSLCDVVISHRITAKVDLDSLKAVMHTYAADIPDKVANLPTFRGAALIIDDNSEKLTMFKTRPRLSKHAGTDACALLAMEAVQGSLRV